MLLAEVAESSKSVARLRVELGFLELPPNGGSVDGVGDALVERAIDAAAAPRCRVLMLAVDERNIPARQLYSRWGFVETHVRDAWIATPRPARG